MSLAVLTKDGSYSLTGAGYTVLVLIMLALLLTACYITKADQKGKTGTRRLVFSAMAMALAFVTSFIRFLSLPMGGASRCSPCSSSASSATGTDSAPA